MDVQKHQDIILWQIIVTIKVFQALSVSNENLMQETKPFVIIKFRPSKQYTQFEHSGKLEKPNWLL